MGDVQDVISDVITIDVGDDNGTDFRSSSSGQVVSELNHR